MCINTNKESNVLKSHKKKNQKEIRVKSVFVFVKKHWMFLFNDGLDSDIWRVRALSIQTLKLVENILAKCRIPLSSKIGVEFFVKSLRQMLPEVYLYIVRTVQNFRIVQVNLLLLEKKKWKYIWKKLKTVITVEKQRRTIYRHKVQTYISSYIYLFALLFRPRYPFIYSRFLNIDAVNYTFGIHKEI